MIPELREKFNSEFSEKNYQLFLKNLNTTFKYPVDFRVSETPVFLTNNFKEKLLKASFEIIDIIKTDDFRKKSSGAIPGNLFVPNEDENPLFLQLDFAVSKDDSENIIPKLIELQGFPSLYCFQKFLSDNYKKFYNIPENLTTYFSGLGDEGYLRILKDIIIKNEDPENVVLLEVEPENQKTRIDFACTEKMIGIETVSLEKVIKKGRNLFYNKNGKEIPIRKIYNRIIFDDIFRKNIKLSFSFSDDLNVSWAGHPNWFFRISKYSLPLLKSEFVPKTFFLNDMKEIPDSLENFVLKPLYSFAGFGVEVDINKEMLQKIPDKRNYILQEKVEYFPVIKTPDINSKVEIRMMFVWNKEPLLVNNLVRMSKGKMMGVAFNYNKSWVGSSVAYHFS